jgi:hypothetical protein
MNTAYPVPYDCYTSVTGSLIRDVAKRIRDIDTSVVQYEQLLIRENLQQQIPCHRRRPFSGSKHAYRSVAALHLSCHSRHVGNNI